MVAEISEFVANFRARGHDFGTFEGDIAEILSRPRLSTIDAHDAAQAIDSKKEGLMEYPGLDNSNANNDITTADGGLEAGIEDAEIEEDLKDDVQEDADADEDERWIEQFIYLCGRDDDDDESGIEGTSCQKGLIRHREDKELQSRSGSQVDTDDCEPRELYIGSMKFPLAAINIFAGDDPDGADTAHSYHLNITLHNNNSCSDSTESIDHSNIYNGSIVLNL